MNRNDSALALSGAGNGDPLVIRKVTTQQPQDPSGSKANPTESNTESNSIEPRILHRWKIRKASQRVLCAAIPKEEWPRVVRCGWSMGALVTLLGKEGRTAWTGIEHCNSVWCCPLCSARIREGRRSEIQQGFEASKKLGLTAWFITFTVPHSLSTSLSSSLGGLREAYKKMRRYSSLKPFFAQVEGVITATEIQVGSSGFHPHRHCIFFMENDATPDEAALKSAWAKAVVKEGLARPSDAVGVVIKRVTNAGLSKYLAKVQENKTTLEMARGDLKSGRQGKEGEWHCAPFDLLDSSVELPISMGQRQKLWVEYFQATKGVSAIRWSRGLKRLLGVGEVSDDELGCLDPLFVEAQLNFLRKEYQRLFKEQPELLAQAQQLFAEQKYIEVLKLGIGSLVLDNNIDDLSGESGEEEPDWGI